MAASGPTGTDRWQPPLEADAADAAEQARDQTEADVDPEAPAAESWPGGADLGEVSEADLAEQLHEVPFDDDGER